MSGAVSGVVPISAADIVGYVEGASDREILGWAWRPGSNERIRVELRCDTGLVSVGEANEEREDLRSNGVGDGHHAFRLEIPPKLKEISPNIRVFAIDNGRAVELRRAPAKIEVSQQLSSLQRGFDLLVNSQRVLHRNLQTVLVKNLDPKLSNGGEASATNNRIEANLATLELFAIRIEQQLISLENLNLPNNQSSKRRLAITCVLISLLISAFALWRSL